MVWTIIGFLIGIILYNFVIKPIERKKIREECIRDGLVPRELADRLTIQKKH